LDAEFAQAFTAEEKDMIVQYCLLISDQQDQPLLGEVFSIWCKLSKGQLGPYLIP
jgi:hypothetical protein